MKSYHILFIAFICFQSCYPKIDIKKASQLVQLDSVDLACFSNFRQQLINDSVAIRRDFEKRNYSVEWENEDEYDKLTKWVSTTSYHLNQIDSSKYKMFFSKLNGKIVDGIYMGKNGCVIFRIKENVQVHVKTYNEAYIHELVSTDCNYSSLKYGDTIFVDSIINKDWRYVFYKALTGW